MFGVRTKPPIDTVFVHEDRCRTADAEPGWHSTEDGRWMRVCSCRTEYSAGRSVELHPNSDAAEPARSEHRHSPDCSALDLPAVVSVRRDELDGGWRSDCPLCQTVCRYWWDPAYYQPDADGEPRRVIQAGNVRYVYALANRPA